ncbi:acetyltransferase GNAT family protein [Asticcacaulis biprosthecium C19]|uniref:Acetyltransferase GNAT family protein n=1 Tax=Asticcacaulis biprosthecium C19 TaxID=715226 RepID=F4QTT1_9CAUL|nr:GNAT family N-acetyltransferase [Asticcacaulis biprosthecium]EGF89231.1 acetyltransferase GNAT family protein [Asticcacaulis biprosthecium C19]
MDIRAVTADDKAAWRPLWQAYLDFYNQPLPDAVTDLTFARFLDPEESMFMVVAHVDGAMVGFATYILHRSTWAKDGYCYLEDLYVDDKARGRGAARALIAAVTEDARSRGMGRLYWVTHDHNARARALYDKVADLTELVQYQTTL